MREKKKLGKRKSFKQCVALVLAALMVVGGFNFSPMKEVKATSIAGTHPTLAQIQAYNFDFGTAEYSVQFGSAAAGGNDAMLVWNSQTFNGPGNCALSVRSLMGDRKTNGELKHVPVCLVRKGYKTAGWTSDYEFWAMGHVGPTVTYPVVGAWREHHTPTSLDELWFDEAGRIYYLNDGVKWYLGYTPDTTNAQTLEMSFFTKDSSAAFTFVQVATPLAKPNASVNYLTNKITGLTVGGSYSINGGTTVTATDGTLTLPSGTYGTNISIVAKGDGSTTTDSEAQSLGVLAKPTVTPPTSKDVTSTSITINTVAGQQYKLGNGNWVTAEGTTYTFNNLNANTSYSITTKKPASTNAPASDESSALTVSTAKTDVTSVTLSGTPTVGTQLSATIAPTGADVSYSWSVGGTVKSTASTYTPVAADIGKSLVLKVTGQNNYQGTKSTTGATVLAKSVSGTSLTLTGTPQVGSSVTAKSNPTTATGTYQWYRGTTPITGANSQTYNPVAADIDSTLTCKFEGNGDYAGAKQEVTTAKVTGKALTGTGLSITGTVEYGSKLTAACNPTTATGTYAWYRGNGTSPVGTGAEYTLTTADIGSVMKCVFTGSGDYKGSTQTATTVTVPAKKVAKDPAANTTTYEYNKAAQTYTPANFDTNTMTVTGNTQTNAGEYTISVSPKSGYAWTDGTTAAKTFTFKINPKPIAVVWGTTTTFTYDSTKTQAPTASASDGTTVITVSVSGGQKNAGIYSGKNAATCTTANTNYTLTNATKDFVINPKTVNVTWSTEALTYNGKAQQPTASAKDGSITVALKYTSTAQTNAGENYSAVVASNDNNYALASDTTTKAYDIAKKTISKLDLNRTYDGTTSFTIDATSTNSTDIVAGDKVPVTVTLPAESAGKAGTYKSPALSLTCGNANYSITESGATLVIPKKTITPIDPGTRGIVDVTNPTTDELKSGEGYVVWDWTGFNPHDDGYTVVADGEEHKPSATLYVNEGGKIVARPMEIAPAQTDIAKDVTVTATDDDYDITDTAEFSVVSGKEELRREIVDLVNKLYKKVQKDNVTDAETNTNKQFKDQTYDAEIEEVREKIDEYNNMEGVVFGGLDDVMKKFDPIEDSKDFAEKHEEALALTEETLGTGDELIAQYDKLIAAIDEYKTFTDDKKPYLKDENESLEAVAEKALEKIKQEKIDELKKYIIDPAEPGSPEDKINKLITDEIDKIEGLEYPDGTEDIVTGIVTGTIDKIEAIKKLIESKKTGGNGEGGGETPAVIQVVDIAIDKIIALPDVVMPESILPAIKEITDGEDEIEKGIHELEELKIKVDTDDEITPETKDKIDRMIEEGITDLIALPYPDPDIVDMITAIVNPIKVKETAIEDLEKDKLTGEDPEGKATEDVVEELDKGIDQIIAVDPTGITAPDTIVSVVTEIKDATIDIMEPMEELEALKKELEVYSPDSKVDETIAVIDQAIDDLKGLTFPAEDLDTKIKAITDPATITGKGVLTLEKLLDKVKAEEEDLTDETFTALVDKIKGGEEDLLAITDPVTDKILVDDIIDVMSQKVPAIMELDESKTDESEDVIEELQAAIDAIDAIPETGVNKVTGDDLTEAIAEVRTDEQLVIDAIHELEAEIARVEADPTITDETKDKLVDMFKGYIDDLNEVTCPSDTLEEDLKEIVDKAKLKDKNAEELEKLLAEVVADKDKQTEETHEKMVTDLVAGIDALTEDADPELTDEEITDIVDILSQKIPAIKKLDERKAGESAEVVGELQQAIDAIDALPETGEDMLTGEELGAAITDIVDKEDRIIKAIKELEAYREDTDSEKTAGIITDGIKALTELPMDCTDEEIADIVTETKTAVDVQREMELKLKDVKAYYEKLVNSGRYNEKGLAQLKEIYEAGVISIGKMKTVATIDAEYDAVIARLDAVKIAYQVTDGVDSSKVNPDNVTNVLTDYPDDYKYEELWGVVSNEEGLDSKIALVIEPQKITDSKKNQVNDSIAQGKFVIAEGSKMTTAQAKEILNNKEVKSVLDIYLLLNNQVVKEFEGSYTIKVLIPKDMRGMKNLQVAYVRDDGTMELFDTTIEGNYLIFTTTHFSEYVVLGDKEADNKAAAPKTGDTSAIPSYLLLFLFAAVAFIGMKKKSYRQ